MPFYPTQSVQPLPDECSRCTRRPDRLRDGNLPSSERTLQRWRQVRELFDTLDLEPWRTRGGELLASAYQLASDLRVDEPLRVRLEWMDTALALAANASPRVRGRVLVARGYVRRLGGNPKGAAEDFDAALSILDKVDYPLGHANVRQRRGDLRLQEDDVAGAATDYTTDTATPAINGPANNASTTFPQTNVTDSKTFNLTNSTVFNGTYVAGTNYVVFANRIADSVTYSFWMAGTYTGGGDMTGADDLCVYSNNGGYDITASGNGGGGAFELIGTSANIPYTVEWATSAGAGTGTALTTGVTLAGQGGTFTTPDCGGADNAQVIVTVDSNDLGSAPADNYIGVLTLLVAPQ